MEDERKVTEPAISRISKIFNAIATENVPKGINIASYYERVITEKEKQNANLIYEDDEQR